MRGLDKESTIKHLDGLLKDDPAGFESTLIDMIQVLEKDGNTEFAYEVVDELTKQHPDESIVSFVQALTARLQIELFLRLPENMTIDAKQLRQCLAVLEQARDLDPFDPVLLALEQASAHLRKTAQKNRRAARRVHNKEQDKARIARATLAGGDGKL